MFNNHNKSITPAFIRVIAALTAAALVFLISGCSKAKNGTDGQSEKETTSESSGAAENKKSVFSPADADVGKTVKFGSYEQDADASDGSEEIEWIVLAKEGGRALLVSKYALDSRPYNESHTDLTWETCTLRKWLNVDFLNEAFSPDELSRIQTSDVAADKNADYDTPPGSGTKDKVFLLSRTEAEKYFDSDDARKCAPTEYAVRQGVKIFDSGKNAQAESPCLWWLRTPGINSSAAVYVYSDGFVMAPGCYVELVYIGIRPALWISLK